MKTFGISIVLMLAIFSNLARAAAVVDVEKLRQAMFLSLLLDDDAGKSRLGVRSIRRFYADQQELSDYIAERLMQGTNTEPKGRFVNTVAWYIDVLGNLADSRYRDVLTQARQRTTNEMFISKIDVALANLGKEQSTPYVAGTLDISRKKEELTQLMVDNRKKDRGAFGQINRGTSLLAVLELIGAPDATSAWTVRTQKLALHYAGTGMVLLSIENEESPHWVTVAVARELLPVAEMYTGEHFGFAQNLGSLQGKILFQFFKSEKRQIGRDVEALAVLAKRVNELPYPHDKYETAVFEKGVVMLGRSHDPRGIEIARKLAAMPAQNRAQRVAKSVVRQYERRSALGIKEEPQDEKEESTDKDDDKGGDKEDGADDDTL